LARGMASGGFSGLLVRWWWCVECDPDISTRHCSRNGRRNDYKYPIFLEYLNVLIYGMDFLSTSMYSSMVMYQPNPSLWHRGYVTPGHPSHRCHVRGLISAGIPSATQGLTVLSFFLSVGSCTHDVYTGSMIQHDFRVATINHSTFHTFCNFHPTPLLSCLSRPERWHTVIVE